MAMIANKCSHVRVTVADLNQERIDAWNSSSLPIYEPGLQELVEKNRGTNLFFTTDITNTLKEADIIFISVGTPTKQHGSGSGSAADLVYIESCARSIAETCDSQKIIVEKSTVPVRTAALLRFFPGGWGVSLVCTAQ